MQPHPQPSQKCDTSTLWRYHGHGGRGTTTIGPECGLTTPGALKCVILFFFSLFLFLPTGLRSSEALSGSRPAELMIQQPGKEKGYDEYPGGHHYEHYICFMNHSAAYPWRGTCLIVPPLAYRTICIVLHIQQSFLNKQCSTFLLIIAFLFYTYVHLRHVASVHFGTAKIHQGLMFPASWCDKSEHFHKCGTPNL